MVLNPEERFSSNHWGACPLALLYYEGYDTTWTCFILVTYPTSSMIQPDQWSSHMHSPGGGETLALH